MQYSRITIHLFIKENKRFSSHFFSFAYTLFDYLGNKKDQINTRNRLRRGGAPVGRRWRGNPHPGVAR